MIEKIKKHKKVSVSEEDSSSLLQRYTATTVLALLQEVAHCPDVKIDWESLVKNTSTGISNAREYQMLWRHLAYRHELLDNFGDSAHSLEDDSDLEYEVEAFPLVSTEVSMEAAACVKVLIASGLPSDSSLPNSSIVEAPLTINIPNGASSRAPSENSEATSSIQGTNITVPVSVQKQPLPTSTLAEGLDVNGSSNGTLPPRRKRKPWSEAEDLELIAAVQKFGEGNWANIVRADFMCDRTASQLSQRWAIIRKRRGNLNVGPNSAGSQLSEARRAAHHAMSLALDMPVKNLTAARPAGTNTTNSSVIPTPTAEAAVVGSSVTQGQDQSQQGLFLAKSSPMGLSSMAKSQVSSKKPSTTPTNGSDSVLRATAVAAGARIASPSDVASFIKATQAKNAVHIKPTTGYSGKSPVPSGVSTHSQTQTAVTITPTASNPSSVKAASPTVQHASSATSSTVLSEQPIAVIPILPNELQSKQGVKTAEEIKVRESGYPPQEQVKEEGVCVSGNAQTEQVQGDQGPSPDKKAEFRKQTTDAKSPVSSLSAESDHKAMIDSQAEARQGTNDKEMVESPVRGDNQSALEEIGENQDTNKEQADLPGMIVDECSEKLEVSIKTETGNEIEGDTKVK